MMQVYKGWYMENKKLDELIKKPTDSSSPESQEILRELHNRSLERQKKMKMMIEEWKEEDK
jgi:hypothetical protein